MRTNSRGSECRRKQKDNQMIPISIQLYTLRDLAKEDFPAVLRLVADIGYKGIEFAGFHGSQPSEIKAIVDDLGLEVSSTHGPLPTAENIGELVDIYAGLFGVDCLVTGFGPPDFNSLESTLATAEKLQRAAYIANSHNLKLCMHNHNWEFDKLSDGRLPYDITLAEAPNLYSELDVYWAAVAGQNPADVVAKYTSRLPLLHIKDGTLGEGREFMAVGSGELDMPSIINAADESVTQWLIVELDNCNTDMVQAVKDSYNYLTSKGLAEGNR